MIVNVVKPKFQLLTPLDHIKDYPRLIELAGRTCYKSEKRITPDSASKFIRMLIQSKHLSVLEHCSITVMVIGSRSMSHQLVRHRIAAYSQESQRYCDYKIRGIRAVCPPSISGSVEEEGTYEKKDDNWFSPSGQALNSQVCELFVDWLDTIAYTYEMYKKFRERGIKAEDARELLTNSTKTEVVTTYNLRQWRHVFEERVLNTHAQWQIRWIMQSIMFKFDELLPDVFADLMEKFKTEMKSEEKNNH